MTGKPSLVVLDETNFHCMPCCGIKCPEHAGRQQKLAWQQANAAFGLRAKCLLAGDGRPAGYIESIPGEFAWRGVDAAGYLMIHCIWNHARGQQRKGWGRLMLEDCLEDARASHMRGVAVVVREGPWLAGQDLFLANGFESVDTAPPDYHLLVRKCKPRSAAPRFRKNWDAKLARYDRGMTLIRSNQCPYIEKFAGEIAQTAADEYGIVPEVVQLESWRDAQDAPTPYAVFALIYDGRLLADHQISRTRFRNIMNRLT